MTNAAALPERREHAGTRRPRRRRVEGARGARCPHRRRPPPERGERAGYTVPVTAASREQRECAARAAPPEFSPSPLPRPPRNAVTPVVMRPMIVTNKQLRRGTGEEGDKG